MTSPPFRINVPGTDLEDLREQLRRTRWPEAATVGGHFAGSSSLRRS